jgi:hypothetical protein
VLESVVGRRYLAQFLEQVGSASLLGYWSAVEELRQTNRSSWHQLAAEIFYTYINTPSPDIRVGKVIAVCCCIPDPKPSGRGGNLGVVHDRIIPNNC